MTQSSPSQWVAAEVRAELARQRRTVVGLSEVTGIPLATLNRRLNRDSKFTIDEIDAIAVALGVPVADLLPARDGAA